MKPKILVVEDDPAIASMIEEILVLEGFDTTVVPDGPRGAREAKSGRFSAVILDVMLPGKDGISVLQEVRAGERTSTTPVILLTARDDAGTTWKGWQAGCDYYLPKPFDPANLVSTVGRLLRAHP